MSFYDSTITYAGQSINVKNVDSIRIQAPYLQKTGRTLSITPVPTDTMAWRLVLQCSIIGSEATLSSARSALQAAEDDKLDHPYVDGQHNGDYVCELIKWSDVGQQASMKTNIQFTLTLIEKKFKGGY